MTTWNDYREADARAFFDKGEGLLVQSLAEAVTDVVPFAVLPTTDELWFFDKGVWRPDTNAQRLRGVLSLLLGQRLRATWVTNVELALKASQAVPRLRDDAPANIHPGLINVANGMLRWQDRQIEEHHPEHLSMVQLPVRWEADAECPMFDAWCEQLLPADVVQSGFLDELMGYVVSGWGNLMQLAVLLMGAGSNGKGTILRLLARMVGEGNCSAVTLTDLAGNRFAVAQLHGKILNVAGDLDPSHLTETAMFKKITGQDLVSAEHKYGQRFDFTNHAVALFSTNRMFSTTDTSHGFLRRWVPLPFTHTITDEDPSIEDKLAAELPGIFARAIDGLRTLNQRGRFKLPQSVMAAHEQFAHNVDQVRAFVAECFTRDPAAHTDRSDVWAMYQHWSFQRNGSDKGGLKPHNLYSRLVEDLGLPATTVRGVPRFKGVKAAPPVLEAARAWSLMV